MPGKTWSGGGDVVGACIDGSHGVRESTEEFTEDGAWALCFVAWSVALQEGLEWPDGVVSVNGAP